MPSKHSSLAEAQTLLTGVAIGELPRWHGQRLWFSDWGAREIIAVDLNGSREVAVRVPFDLPFSIDGLPDGRLLIVSGRPGLLLRREPDGSLVTHSDLRSLSRKGWNEIVVDGCGNIYVNGGTFDPETGGMSPGIIAMIAPDGSARRVVDDIAFPNGMAITPDNSTLIIAESHGKKLSAFDIARDGSLSNRRYGLSSTDTLTASASMPRMQLGTLTFETSVACVCRKGEKCCKRSSLTEAASRACLEVSSIERYLDSCGISGYGKYVGSCTREDETGINY